MSGNHSDLASEDAQATKALCVGVFFKREWLLLCLQARNSDFGETLSLLNYFF